MIGPYMRYVQLKTMITGSHKWAQAYKEVLTL